jgi:Flp pilus assembly protein TadG
MKHLRSLLADRKGVAAVEFAFVSVFLFATLMVALDFGFYTQQKLRLGSVVEQAAILAYNKGYGTAAAPSTNTVSDYIKNYSNLAIAPTTSGVQITCNGTGACGTDSCSCITTAGDFTAAGTCNTLCPGGGLSGTYLRISASAAYKSVVVPNKYLNNGTMTQVAVVRLK